MALHVLSGGRHTRVSTFANCGGDKKAGLISNIGRKLPIMRYMLRPLPTKCDYTFSPTGNRRHAYLRMLG